MKRPIGRDWLLWNWLTRPLLLALWSILSLDVTTISLLLIDDGTAQQERSDITATWLLFQPSELEFELKQARLLENKGNLMERPTRRWAQSRQALDNNKKKDERNGAGTQSSLIFKQSSWLLGLKQGNLLWITVGSLYRLLPHWGHPLLLNGSSYKGSPFTDSRSAGRRDQIEKVGAAPSSLFRFFFRRVHRRPTKSTTRKSTTIQFGQQSRRP